VIPEPAGELVQPGQPSTDAGCGNSPPNAVTSARIGSDEIQLSISAATSPG
jgi:hypothetical protein